MNLLNPSSAKYFCGSFSAAPSSINCSIEDLVNLRPRIKNYIEGTLEYSELRDCLLREAARSLYLSNSLHASSMKFIRESTAWWSVVAHYYSVFYAAKALLAMHGGYIKNKNYWLEVDSQTTGSISIRVNNNRKVDHPATITGPKGSHRDFWKIFYLAVRPLYTHAPASSAFSLTPINSSDTWLIDTRNRYNYNSAEALNCLNDFLRTYDSHNVPKCIPGYLYVMINTSTALRNLVATWRNDYGLSVDVLQNHFPNLQDAVDGFLKNNRDAGLDLYATSEINNLVV